MEGPSWAFALRTRTHVRYLRYVLLHKWRVLRAGLPLGVPLWQLLVHDMSKFSSEEWGPYARWFYTRAPDGRTWYEVYKEARDLHPGCMSEPWQTARNLKADFDGAWVHHQRYNDHHWESWKRQPMPDRYAREMVADWTAAGMDKGFLDVHEWYVLNRTRILLHPDTRVLVERLLALPT